MPIGGFTAHSGACTGTAEPQDVGLEEGTGMFDIPKSLGDPVHNAARRTRVLDPHVRELTAFVESIRRERGLNEEVPYFDPADGGIEADCLFVLEAPGPKAVRSGFVSRNNPDESAKTWLEVNAIAGIPRHRTVIWNIVPWFLGADGRIRPAKARDIDDGWPYLIQLVNLLPRLRVVVLAGGKAQSVASRLRKSRPELKVLGCPHPSPMFVNRNPKNRDALVISLREVAAVMFA
jgi:uracil-DNA glycosylase